MAARVAALSVAAAAAVHCSGREPFGGGARATSAPAPTTGLAVFPGAEGYGTRTRAGRGGKVIAVTSLADDGPGTLRAALRDPAPRTIVFRVGGVIQLASHLFISEPFVTVAGQTAPGDGVVLKDFGIVITTNDVLVQHLRIRPGDAGAVRPDHNDAVAILGRNGDVSGAWNVVLDHISASWGEDETISTWFGPHDVTISWSIVSEGLNKGRHPKRTHSAGLIVGDGSDRVSIHHNLLAHNDFRNPLIQSGGTHDVVNNVVYDWGVLPTEVVDDARTSVNVVGNYYRAGSSSQTPNPILINPADDRQVTKIYLAGNATPDGQPDEQWRLVQFGWRSRPVPDDYKALAPFPTAAITATSAAEARDLVLAGAGATAPRRDAIDARIVANVRNGTGSLIDSPRQVGGYPEYREGVAPADGDGDGMSDEWERGRGLDPANAADGAEDDDGDGYTNLEEYLHSLTRRS